MTLGVVVLLVYVAATLRMAGVSWFLQVVHHPTAWAGTLVVILLSSTDPKGFALCMLVALVGEVLLVLGTLVSLRRTALSRSRHESEQEVER
jgi:hypothetical protein